MPMRGAIDCCRGPGRIHPFKDANGRLLMFLVLNKLLMENGLAPTTSYSIATGSRNGTTKIRRSSSQCRSPTYDST